MLVFVGHSCIQIIMDIQQGQGWKVVASFEGVLPKRIKSLPLDQMFEISSIKKVSQLIIVSFLT